jgi:hypothetical protein
MKTKCKKCPYYGSDILYSIPILKSMCYDLSKCPKLEIYREFKEHIIEVSK